MEDGIRIIIMMMIREKDINQIDQWMMIIIAQVMEKMMTIIEDGIIKDTEIYIAIQPIVFVFWFVA